VGWDTGSQLKLRFIATLCATFWVWGGQSGRWAEHLSGGNGYPCALCLVRLRRQARLLFVFSAASSSAPSSFGSFGLSLWCPCTGCTENFKLNVRPLVVCLPLLRVCCLLCLQIVSSGFSMISHPVWTPGHICWFKEVKRRSRKENIPTYAWIQCCSWILVFIYPEILHFFSYKCYLCSQS